MANNPLSKVIGGIRFGVSMDTRKLRKDIKQAQTLTGKFVKKTKELSRHLSVLGTVAAGAFGTLVKSQFAAVDSLAKTADKLGITTEALAGLRHAAEISGVAVRTFDMALQRMVRRVAEASQGLGESRAALRELGLDAKALAQLSPDQQFLQIAAAMSKVEDQNQRVRLAFKLFDSEGVALVNTLNLGVKEIERLNAEAEKLGLTVTREEARRIEQANDAMTRMWSAAQGLGRTLAIEVAPEVEKIADSITAWTTGTKQFQATIKGQRYAGLGFNVRRGSIGDRVMRGVSEFGRGIFAGPQLRPTAPQDNARQQRSRNPEGPWLRAIRDAMAEGIPKGFEKAQKFISEGASRIRQEKLGSRIVQSVAGGLRGVRDNTLAALGRGGIGLFNLRNQLSAAKFRQDQELAQQATTSRRGTLALTETGTVASYRQRAAIRQQRESMNLDKKRNALLTKINNSLGQNGGGLSLAPAGLA